MRIAILTVTDAGFELAEKISARMEVQIFGKGKNFDSLKDFVAEIFDKFDALIFICATGIAVRMIAPHIVSKLEDPAVIVLDERGRNVISLLSGHVGGANELTLKIAAAINSNPVITTATDVENKFAADTFAAKLGLVPTPKSAIQAINSAVLREEEIYLTAGNVQLKLTATDTENKFAANFETLKTSINGADLREEPIYITAGNVQLKLTATDTENKFAANLETLKTSINAADLREEPIYITAGNVQLKLTATDAENKFAANLETLTTSINKAVLREEPIYLTAGNVRMNLIPQKLIAGIGCKRGTSAEKIFDAVQSACEMINQPLARIKLLASVDIKRDEKGLLEFAENLGVDIKFFPVEELAKKIAAYRLSESAFVKAALGVGNVCEAAALCCVERARFALNKKSFDGVTVALIWEKI